MTVRGLATTDLLRVWEVGTALHPIDRALLLCAVAAPDAEPGALAALSLGERDARLLALRERTFGQRLDAVVNCEQCDAVLEISVTVDALRVAPPDVEPRVVFDDRELALRRLDSRDLAAVAAIADAASARDALIARGVVGEAGALSESEQAALARRLGELDPQADLVFDLTCSECAHRFSVPFDIAGFLWGEVSVEARRLLQEVAALARAFHWSEAEILAMSQKRRRTYLELADA